ncbi:MAG TPA: molybdopterin dinucleotide binding domain-containing protein [Gemmataceae bacterium]|nr:molybdopterin dinucleotide binding domain-containing protein [Gemmataceae bacterium]
MNGIRLVQIHPKAAAAAGIKDGDAIVVESPRDAVTGTALLWTGIREDTIFVPNTFGPMEKMAVEFGDPLYQPTNILLDDRYYDNLSGQQAYRLEFGCCSLQLAACTESKPGPRPGWNGGALQCKVLWRSYSRRRDVSNSR